MRNLFILAIIIAGGYQLYVKYQEHATAAYDENGNPRTLLFTFNGCKPCDDARTLLTKRHVDFEEFNVSEGDAQADKMKAYGGGRILPYLVTGNRKLSGFNKYELIGALAEVHGQKLLTRQEQNIMKTNFDSAGNPRVVMYGTQRCGYCIKAREYFNDEGVEYTEFDIEKSSVANRNFKALEAHGTPLVYVGYRRVDGFNRNKLDAALAAYRP